MIKSASQQSLAESLAWVNDLSPKDVTEFDDDSTHDSTSSPPPEYTPGCFEGPEKTMEVVFRTDQGHVDGLRALDRSQLDYLCTKARCTILHSVSNHYMDAYILSESSLFVYKHRLIMKTCGTTTLLRCLGSVLDFAETLGMELEWVGYSRKNLNNPDAQIWPHSSFPDEMQYLTSHKKLQSRLRGSGHILGPVTGDHWYVYVADHTRGTKNNSHTNSAVNLTRCPSPPHYLGGGSSTSVVSRERTVNLMMFDMAPEVGELFYLSKTPDAKSMTLNSGIHHLVPGALIDETAFTPCGYSMNAILYDSYSTIHITPEPGCSYCSFETNNPLQSYSSLVRNVLNIFKPERFVLTIIGDEEAVDEVVQQGGAVVSDKQVRVSGWGVYNRTAASSAKVDADLTCQMACYSLAV